MVWQSQGRFLDVIWSSRPVESCVWWWTFWQTEQMSSSESREDNGLACNLSVFLFFTSPDGKIQSRNYTTAATSLSLVKYSFGSTLTKLLITHIVLWKIILNVLIFNFSISSGRSHDVWKGAATDNQVWFTNRTSISQSSKVWQSLER